MDDNLAATIDKLKKKVYASEVLVNMPTGEYNEHGRPTYTIEKFTDVIAYPMSGSSIMIFDIKQEICYEISLSLLIKITYTKETSQFIIGVLEQSIRDGTKAREDTYR